MSIKILETSINNGEQYDISEMCSGIVWATSLESQPGRLDFKMVDDKKVFLRSGDVIEVSVDGKNIFKGKVFVRSKDESHLWSITAYDNTRYLKNEDTLVFNASCASERFETICQTQGLPYKILDKSNYNCAPVVEDKHTYYSMLEDALIETRENQGVRYGFRDNFGTLEFFNLNRGITKLVIGDQSLMTSYAYEASIDDAATSVQVMREDRNKGKREIYEEKDPKNIERWGRLQVVETVSDADLNSSQLRNQAKVLLKEKNREIRSLSITAISDLSIRAGNSFILRIADLQRDGYGKDSLALVKSCRHHLSQKEMILQIEVVA